ncbi:MAG: TetR/AcrR family transcriptional regulator, cholesterol catabolism regulator [Pseudomonadota bacterium]|nr:TetR/AcrR family transcriptional regulator, cholesterol catabolism regulator [Pseudomonadota bacterium]
MSRRPDDAGRRGQLIRESARLFREKGYEATSVRDIAAATGLQSGSWVYHFKTKQDILAAVMEEGLQRALERIEAIGRDQLPPREQFRALLRAHLDTILAPGQDFIPVLLYEWRSLEAKSRPRVVALQRRYEAVWEKVIAQLRRSGDWVQPTRVDRLLMFGALNWMAHWYRPDGPFDVSELADEAERFFLRSPRARAKPAARPRVARRTGTARR